MRFLARSVASIHFVVLIHLIGNAHKNVENVYTIASFDSDLEYSGLINGFIFPIVPTEIKLRHQVAIADQQRKGTNHLERPNAVLFIDRH